MKGKIWVKSMLEAYNHINKVIKTIDKQVIDKGVKSHFTFGYVETMEVMDAIIELERRKQKLVCIKNLVEDSLKTIPRQSAEILALRFIDKLSDSEIAKLLKVSKRTFFRILDKALGDCYVAFLRLGFNCEYLERQLENEKWLVSFYNQNVDKKTQKKKLKFSNISNKASVVNYLWN